MCSSAKYPFPPQRKVNKKFQGGGGASKDQLFKGKYDANIEFPAGIGGQAKKPSVGGVCRVRTLFQKQISRTFPGLFQTSD